MSIGHLLLDSNKVVKKRKNRLIYLGDGFIIINCVFAIIYFITKDSMNLVVKFPSLKASFFINCK